MSTFNRGEYGSKIYVNLGTDISTGTDYKVYIQPQRGEIKEFTTNIALGTSNIAVDDSKYLANQYLEYTLQEDDLDESGLWRIRGSVIVGSELIKSDYMKITILP